MSRSAEQAFGHLASEIERLPKSKIRTALEIEHAYAEYQPNSAVYRDFRDLRFLVTKARAEVAKTDLHALKAELANQGGLIEWNRSPWETRLNKWLLGYEASGFDTVGAFFDEAATIAEAFDLAIYKARPQPRRFLKQEAPAHTGKTLRELKKTARTARNKAARAEENRGHVKGKSPGADKGGQKKKK